MSSIYKDKWIKEIEQELSELINKKNNYGWTKKDAERYNYLIKQLQDE